MEIKRNEKGYPVDENGEIDWHLTSIEKQKVSDEYDRKNHVGGKVRFKPTNVTAKKKKRK